MDLPALETLSENGNHEQNEMGNFVFVVSIEKFSAFFAKFSITGVVLLRLRDILSGEMFET